MNNELVIIRGIPGSAKSTLAKTYIAKGYKHFEADMFFMIDGEYKFDIKKIGEAHLDCQYKTKDALQEGYNVVVSNTNTTLKEVNRYINIAKDVDVPFRIIHCKGEFKNVHNVPEDVLQKMKDRMVNIEGEEYYYPIVKD